jgi:hypothetical protein
MAQLKDIDQIGQRSGPEDFGPFGDMGECFVVPQSIPDNVPAGVTMSLDIPCEGQDAITDLDVSLQISHTWVGDLTVRITKQGGPTALILDRVGLPEIDPTFGCSGDDIDAILDDGAATPVEDECDAGVPTISGEFIPGDPPGPLLAAFNGEDQCGTWELNVADFFDGDTGVVFGWCVIFNTPAGDDGGDDGGGDDGGGDDGGGVPASTGIGIALLLLVLFGSSVYFLRRRATT